MPSKSAVLIGKNPSEGQTVPCHKRRGDDGTYADEAVCSESLTTDR